MDYDDEAENFFFANRGVPAAASLMGRAQTSDIDSAMMSVRQVSAIDDAAAFAAAAASRAPRAAEVIQLTTQLVELSMEAPRVIALLKHSIGEDDNNGSNNGSRNNKKILPQMTMIELRRQQQQLAEHVSRVVTPLDDVFAQWEENVVRNIESIKQSVANKILDEDAADKALEGNDPQQLARVEQGNAAKATLQQLKAAFAEGDEAAKMMIAQGTSAELTRLSKERERELRLASDLLELHVW